MKLDLMPHQTLFMHLTLLPFLKSAGETKTKPTQRSVKEMLSHGLQPDILVCRSDEQMEEESISEETEVKAEESDTKKEEKKSEEAKK